MRFTALVAAIVCIVRRRKIEQTEMGSFWLVREKKVWKAFPRFWDRIRARGHTLKIVATRPIAAASMNRLP